MSFLRPEVFHVFVEPGHISPIRTCDFRLVKFDFARHYFLLSFVMFTTLPIITLATFLSERQATLGLLLFVFTVR